VPGRLSFPASAPIRAPVCDFALLRPHRDQTGTAFGDVGAERRATDESVQAAVAIANKILQGQEDPYTSARQPRRMQTTFDRLQADLLVFVGLSDREDLPQDREALECEIVVAADRFRAQWRP
jgi:hypothetical protein